MKRKRPGISQEQLLSKIARLSIPDFVRMLREAGYGNQVKVARRRVKVRL
ncbi:MAG: hypothetical protein L0220_06795 [Acidobacteria bacterium]|nr:hypothetical protein [Acidobacteriota bacterium]